MHIRLLATLCVIGLSLGAICGCIAGHDDNNHQEQHQKVQDQQQQQQTIEPYHTYP
jgi:hypothetical protein